MSELGTYERIDGKPAIRYHRTLAHPVAAVWRALTEPDGLAAWFPSTIDVTEWRVGAPLAFTFEEYDVPPSTGEVVDVQPPRVLAFTWEGELLRFELEDADGGAATRLRFTTILAAEDTAARNAAGWQICLEGLASYLDGTPLEDHTGPTPQWQALYDAYIQAGVPHGAEIPPRRED